MSAQDRRCGTCKHYDAGGLSFYGSALPMNLGRCNSPLPASICDDSLELMQSNEGTECQCWEAKE